MEVIRMKGDESKRLKELGTNKREARKNKLLATLTDEKMIEIIKEIEKTANYIDWFYPYREDLKKINEATPDSFNKIRELQKETSRELTECFTEHNLLHTVYFRSRLCEISLWTQKRMGQLLNIEELKQATIMEAKAKELISLCDIRMDELNPQT